LVLFITTLSADAATSEAIVIGNVLPSPLVKVIVDTFTEAVTIPLRGKDDVLAYDAEVEFSAQEAVPAVDVI